MVATWGECPNGIMVVRLDSPLELRVVEHQQPRGVAVPHPLVLAASCLHSKKVSEGVATKLPEVLPNSINPHATEGVVVVEVRGVIGEEPNSLPMLVDSES